MSSYAYRIIVFKTINYLQIQKKSIDEVTLIFVMNVNKIHILYQNFNKC